MRRLACLFLLVAGCGGGNVPGSAGPGRSDPASPSPLDTPAGFPDGGGGGGGGGSGGGGGAPTPAGDPCGAATLGDGAYCGSELKGGDAATLYHCAAAKTASSEPCALGCHVAPAGVADYCDDGGVYHLPWSCGASYDTTQGNHGDICGGGTGDHTGVQDYAWDFGLPRHTAVLASRAGTVTLSANVTAPGQGCYDGCTQPFGTQSFWDCCNSCLNTSNHVNVQHADGTVATYWHLDVALAKPGSHVNAGDILGYSGTSGCSSGPHLHFQVMGNCPNGYCQSIAIAFLNNQKPICGVVEKSDNACH